MSLRIRKNDLVVVQKGKDKQKTGRVLKIISGKSRTTAVVEGVNLVKKHMRKRSEQQPSGIIEAPAPINVANLSLWCNSCKKGVRFSIKILEDRSKIRICRQCQNSL